MKQKLPTRRMRQRPDLEQLKRQAKELLRRFAAGEAEASAEVNAHYRAADAARFALHDAQLGQVIDFELPTIVDVAAGFLFFAA